MAKTRQQKEAELQKIQDKLGRAKAIVFADYKGLNMKQLADLRDKLREQNAEFSITKNTLLTRALPASNFQLPVSSLQGPARIATQNVARLPETGTVGQAGGPTATLFAYDDEISPIKTLVKAFKDYSLGKVKSGFLGKDTLDEAKIIQLSTLPTKDELRGKTVGVLVAPLQGMLSVLNGNLRNLVYALNQIKIQKGGE